MEATKVLIADDHQVMRKGVRAVVELLEGWEVCGEASTGREAVEMVERLRPQIVVMDVTMPELNGLEATRQIKKILPATEVLMFTGLETEELIRQVFEAGARSYILKTDGREQLEAALTALAAHKPFVVTFATPRFCTSRTCGPVVDVVDYVRRKYAARGVRFIHVEVFKQNRPALGYNRWMRQWGLQSEPWTFLVGQDGRIEAKFEGSVSAAELEAAIRRSLL